MLPRTLNDEPVVHLAAWVLVGHNALDSERPLCNATDDGEVTEDPMSATCDDCMEVYGQ